MLCHTLYASAGANVTRPYSLSRVFYLFLLDHILTNDKKTYLAYSGKKIMPSALDSLTWQRLGGGH